MNTSSNKPSTFWNAVRADVLTTLLLSPLVAVAVIVMAFLSLIMDAGAVREGLLPVIVVILVIALADIAVRDHSSGMLNLLFTSPKLQRHYVAWKFASAFLITLCFTIIPLARLLFTAPSTALSLWIGSMFLSAGAIGLGIMTRNQKPFIAIILMLLYIALNAAHEPLFDFIGSNGCATWRFQLGYGILALILLGSAQRKHAAILKSL